MAEAIKAKFGVDATLIEGAGGVFDVHVNGTQIWDKSKTNRFPEHHEILDRMGETLKR